MSAWLNALPALAIAAVVLFGPGALVGRTLGIRGLALWAMSAPLSVSLVALTAVFAAAVGVPWSPLLVLVPTGVAALVAWRVASYLRVPTAVRSPWYASWASAVALAVGALLVLLVAGRGMGSPDALSHTFDAVFHLNAVRWGLDHQDLSSLHLGAVTHPVSGTGFYPAAWHAVAASVASLSGASVPLAANVTALAVAGLVWPAGILLLVRQVAGRLGPVALVAGGVLSAGFLAFPYLLLSFGVLWPYVLATALLPACIAAALSASRAAADDEIGQRAGVVLLVLSLPGLALAHPAGILTLFVVLLAVAGPPLIRWARRAGPRRVLPIALAAGIVLAAGLAAGWSQLDRVNQFDWRAGETLAQAAGEVLLNAPTRGPAAWALSLLVVAGMVVTAQSARMAWLPIAHLALALLYILASGSDGWWAQTLTGPWYNDAFRLSAATAVTGVPLAVLGVLALAKRLPGGGLHLRQLVVLLAAVALSGGLQHTNHTQRVALTYRPAGGDTYLSGADRVFLEGLGQWVKPGQVVIGSPWNGSALVYALADRPVVFAHLSGAWSGDGLFLAKSLAGAPRDPAVCAAAHRLGVRYALDGPRSFWALDPRQGAFEGVVNLSGRPGLTQIAQGGRFTLYRLDGCA